MKRQMNRLPTQINSRTRNKPKLASTMDEGSKTAEKKNLWNQAHKTTDHSNTGEKVAKEP
jgi:hypothetical protein